MEIAPHNEAAAALLERFGIARDKGVVVVNLEDQTARGDFCAWENSPVMATAHAYIDGRFDKLADGDIVDVEFILGETPKGDGDPFNE
jgi:hypothetical protein